jgi:hypothetical protein
MWCLYVFQGRVDRLQGIARPRGEWQPLGDTRGSGDTVGAAAGDPGGRVVIYTGYANGLVIIKLQCSHIHIIDLNHNRGGSVSGVILQLLR